MNHHDFDWDFENIAHITRHGVTTDEAEEVFDHITAFLRTENYEGEVRFVEVGHTHDGRMLEVVTTLRRGKTRVVTAYKPSKLSVAAFHLAVGGASE
jgi:uncharacterized DUF497 family protein